jgi:hypothetical protein
MIAQPAMEMSEMVKSSFVRWLAYSAVIGLVVPTAITLTQEIVVPNRQFARCFDDALYQFMRIVWPSSIFMMATDGLPKWSSTSIMFLSMSIIANIVLYCVVGCALWWIARIVNTARIK